MIKSTYIRDKLNKRAFASLLVLVKRTACILYRGCVWVCSLAGCVCWNIFTTLPLKSIYIFFVNMSHCDTTSNSCWASAWSESQCADGPLHQRAVVEFLQSNGSYGRLLIRASITIVSKANRWEAVNLFWQILSWPWGQSAGGLRWLMLPWRLGCVTLHVAGWCRDEEMGQGETCFPLIDG